MSELMMLQNLSMLGGSGLLKVAFMLCLFGVVIFRSEKIRHPMLLRWACTLFGLSILLPTCVQMGLSTFFQSNVPLRNTPGSAMWIYSIPTQVDSILFAMAVMVCFGALLPPSFKTQPTQPTTERLHPLD